MTNLFDQEDSLPEMAGDSSQPEPSHALSFNAWPVDGVFDPAAQGDDDDLPRRVEITAWANVFDDGTATVRPNVETLPDWLWSEYNRTCNQPDNSGEWLVRKRIAIHHREHPDVWEMLNTDEPNATGWIMDIDTGELTPPIGLEP